MFRPKSAFICLSAVLVVATTTPAEAEYQPERELSRSRSPALRARPEPEVVDCERRASCGVADANARLPFHTRNCFCDALCRVYDDCCADFRPPPPAAETETETGSGGGGFPSLPRSAVTCARVEEIDTAYEIYVVTRCPRHRRGVAVDRSVRDRCEDDRLAGEFYRLPVSGVASGVLYRNAYCAICANESAYLFWRMAHLCVGGGGGAGAGAGDAAPPDVREMMRCPPELLPPELGGADDGAERLRPRKCKSHVSQCEGRRRGGQGGGRQRRRCRGPTSYVYDGLQVHDWRLNTPSYVPVGGVTQW